MNQHDATERAAECLKIAASIKHVNIGQAVEGNHPDVLIVTFLDGLILSITVEILAQP